MKGKAYAIVCSGKIVAISLSRLSAQEVLMDYALEDATWWYNYYTKSYKHDIALREANNSLSEWNIWEYNLV